MSITELWRKNVGHIEFVAIEHDGIETITGRITYSCAMSFTLHEKELSTLDLETYTRDRIIREIDGALLKLHDDIHS